MPYESDSIWSFFPAPTRGHRRCEILSERRFAKTLAQAGLLREFANSFLVMARPEKHVERFKCIRFIGADYTRIPEYQTNTKICLNNNRKIVIKTAETYKAEGFMQEIAKRETLARDFIKGKAEVITGRLEDFCLYYPYVNGASLKDLIADDLRSGCFDSGKSLIKDYARFLYDLPTTSCIPDDFMREFDISSKAIGKPVACLQKGLLDIIPRNIKVSNGTWYIIDNEWTYDFPVPVDYLVFRGIGTLVVELQALIQSMVSENRPVTIFWGYGKGREYIPLAWFGVLQEMRIPHDQMIAWETQFQNHVHSPWRNLRLRLDKNPRKLSHVAINEIKTDSGSLNGILSMLRKVLKGILRACHNCRKRSFLID
jgi:hypothetical protein